MSMIYNVDLIPRLIDAGVVAVIRSLSYENLPDVSAFLAQLNSQITPLRVTEQPLLQLLADMHAVNELLDVAYAGTLPNAIARYAAPTGLGADTNGVWFSTPETGTEYVRWYVNGRLVLRREQDLSSNRSATLAELTAQSGDVVQIAIEAGSVVGWWARIEV